MSSPSVDLIEAAAPTEVTAAPGPSYCPATCAAIYGNYSIRLRDGSCAIPTSIAISTIYCT